MAKVFQNIVIATDGSSCSNAAVKLGAELAEKFGAKVTLVYVFEPIKYALPEGYIPYTAEQLTEMTDHFEQMLRAAKEQALSYGAPHVDTRLLQGVAPEEVCSFASRELADLIVVGTHGRGFVGRMLVGSVAEKIVRSAPVPVLTARDAT
jgi:nucleotide-binding universal stress UspA family protein